MTDKNWDLGCRRFTTAAATDAIGKYLEDRPATREYLEGVSARLADAGEGDGDGTLCEAYGAAYELACAIRGELPKNASFVAIEDATREYLGIQ